MPTIDQLAPATAASDTDQLLVSQHGLTRKVSRQQILAGVQSQLALGSGTLLGRASGGTGSPEQITIGANLTLANGALTANATPFNVATLNSGTVPASTDLVPLGQAGANRSVTYGQFMNGLASVGNVNVSQLLVTPTGTQSPTKLGDLAAGTLMLGGGALTGALTLAADPATSLQAATKRYVDTQVGTTLAKSGGTLSGGLTLAADPATSLQAATKQYVDGQVGTAVPKAGGTLTGALSLPADPTSALHASTKQYVDTHVTRKGDTLTGALILAGDPTTSLQATTKNYVDVQVGTSLPKTGGTLGGVLTLAADPAASMQAATKRYVDTQTATSLPLGGGALTGPLTLAASPASALHAAPKQYVDGQVAAALPLAGGTLAGSLTLAADPSQSLHAATKRYVDTVSGGATGVINVRSAPYNALLNGVADDTAAFKAAYQAAAAGAVIYVPNGVTVLQSPNNWGIPITKKVKWVVDGTSLPDGTPLSNSIPGGASPASLCLPGIVVGNSGQSAEISQSVSQANDFAVTHSSYIVSHNGGPIGGAVISNARTDTIIYNSPNNFVWGGVDRLLWCGIQTPSAANTAEHVGRYVQTIRQAIGTDALGSPLPQPHLWAACLEYRDITGQPSSWAGGSITVEMDWFGNGPDDGSKRQLQSLVVGQHNTSGAPVEVSTIIGVYLAGGSSGHTYTVLNINIPFSYAVLDTTHAEQMAGAAAIRLAAGHSIAFEPTNDCRLAFDSSTGTLRWYQGPLSFAVGKGISVGWQLVYSSSATIPGYVAGHIVILVGSSPYTITLPPTSTVAAGTGFTFTMLGSTNVTIATTGGDGIDNGPVILRPHDRYHVVSDGGSCWHEIFRTNSVSPRFTGPPVMPSYTVSVLPAAPGAGAKGFASNGRKPNEGAGAGTGVEVFHDGVHWISVCSGAQVIA
ncbi:MAG: hypothetical protein WDN25_09240 [Acetobacteraceae bacterium]